MLRMKVGHCFNDLYVYMLTCTYSRGDYAWMNMILRLYIFRVFLGSVVLFHMKPQKMMRFFCEIEEINFKKIVLNL
jgi:hypothetical protein